MNRRTYFKSWYIKNRTLMLKRARDQYDAIKQDPAAYLFLLEKERLRKRRKFNRVRTYKVSQVRLTLRGSL